MTRDYQDLPPYDVVDLENQRQQRAKDFAKAVKSLTRFDMRASDDRKDKWVSRGASYAISDGKELEVMRQGYFTSPEHSTSAVRLNGPWTEHQGIDGHLRRARKTRTIKLTVTPGFEVTSDDDELPDPPESLQEAIESLEKLKEKQNFAKSIDPDYRLPELIEAKSSSIVEVKLKLGPNWRTEREETLSGRDTKLSNLAAQRQAGVEIEERDYSIQEHEELMFLLQMIKMSRIKAMRLEQEII